MLVWISRLLAHGTLSQSTCMSDWIVCKISGLDCVSASSCRKVCQTQLSVFSALDCFFCNVLFVPVCMSDSDVYALHVTIHICLSNMYLIYLPVHLHVSLHVCLSNGNLLHLSVCLNIYLYACPLNVYLTLFVYVSLSVSTCLHVLWISYILAYVSSCCLWEYLWTSPRYPPPPPHASHILNILRFSSPDSDRGCQMHGYRQAVTLQRLMAAATGREKPINTCYTKWSFEGGGGGGGVEMSIAFTAHEPSVDDDTLKGVDIYGKSSLLTRSLSEISRIVIYLINIYYVKYILW